MKRQIRFLQFFFFLIFPTTAFALKSGSSDEMVIELLLAFIFGAIFITIITFERIRYRWIPAIHARLHPEINLLEDESLMIDSEQQTAESRMENDNGTGTGPIENE